MTPVVEPGRLTLINSSSSPPTVHTSIPPTRPPELARGEMGYIAKVGVGRSHLIYPPNLLELGPGFLSMSGAQRRILMGLTRSGGVYRYERYNSGERKRRRTRDYTFCVCELTTTVTTVDSSSRDPCGPNSTSTHHVRILAAKLLEGKYVCKLMLSACYQLD